MRRGSGGAKVYVVPGSLKFSGGLVRWQSEHNVTRIMLLASRVAFTLHLGENKCCIPGSWGLEKIEVSRFDTKLTL